MLGWLSWLSVWLLISAQVMISWSWDQAPHWVLCWLWSLLGILSLSLSLSLPLRWCKHVRACVCVCLCARVRAHAHALALSQIKLKKKKEILYFRFIPGWILLKKLIRLRKFTWVSYVYEKSVVNWDKSSLKYFLNSFDKLGAIPGVRKQQRTKQLALLELTF